MEHISRSFSVSLSTRHPNMDPTEITNVLELFPNSAHQAGSPRRTPKGDPLPGTYSDSYWSHPFDVTGARELGPILEDLARRLWTHKPFFHRIVNEQGTVELFCGVFVEGNWDEIMPHQLMSALADLRIDLRLDVYPPIEPSTT